MQAWTKEKTCKVGWERVRWLRLTLLRWSWTVLQESSPATAGSTHMHINTLDWECKPCMQCNLCMFFVHCHFRLLYFYSSPTPCIYSQRINTAHLCMYACMYARVCASITCALAGKLARTIPGSSLLCMAVAETIWAEDMEEMLCRAFSLAFWSCM